MANWSVAKKIDEDKLVVEGRKVPAITEDGGGYNSFSSLLPGELTGDFMRINFSNPGAVVRFSKRHGFLVVGAGKLRQSLTRRGAAISDLFPTLSGAMNIEGAISAEYDWLDSVEGFSNRAVPRWAAIEYVSPTSKLIWKKAVEGDGSFAGAIMSVKESIFWGAQLQMAFALQMSYNAFDGDLEKVLDYIQAGHSPFRSGKRAGCEFPQPFLSVGAEYDKGSRGHDANGFESAATWLAGEASGPLTRSEVLLAAKKHDHIDQETVAQAVKSSYEFLRTLRVVSAQTHDLTMDSSFKALQRVVAARDDAAEISSEGSIVEALIDDLFATVLSLDEWHVCENPSCGGLFKDLKTTGRGIRSKRKKLKYCSNACKTSASRIRSRVV